MIRDYDVTCLDFMGPGRHYVVHISDVAGPAQAKAACQRKANDAGYRIDWRTLRASRCIAGYTVFCGDTNYLDGYGRPSR